MNSASLVLRRRLLLLLLALGFAAIAIFHPQSMFRSPDAMDRYFGGEVSLGSWQWVGSWSAEIPPFKYRIVFRGLVDGLADLLSPIEGRTLRVYWSALVSVTIGSIVFAVAAAWRFLAAAGVPSVAVRFAVLGLWFCMPPFHHAFVIPTQTKEDFLAYGILFAGLTAMLQSKFAWVVAWSVVGVATRETLLLLPMVLVLGSTASVRAKAAGCAVGIATFVVLRVLLGLGGHEIVRMENFHGALIPVALFFVLGSGWLLVGSRFGITRLRADVGIVIDSLRSGTGGRTAGERFEATFVPVAVLLLALHVFAARVAEIRISFLLAPWVVLAAARWLGGVSDRGRWLRASLGAGAMLAVLGGLEVSGVMSAVREAVNPSIAEFGARVWWLEWEVQLVLMAGLVGLRRG